MPSPAQNSTAPQSDGKASRPRLAHWVRIAATHVMTALTAIALALAVWQLILATSSQSDMKAIAEAVSTRYIDQFPANMPAITSLLSRTRSRVLIATDWAAYGEYSEPENFEDYRHVLVRDLGLDQEISVDLYVYNEETMREAIKGQLPPEKFEKERNSPEFKRYFANRKSPPSSYKEFLDVLIAREMAIRKEFDDNGITLHDLDKQLPVFYWVRDSDEAIFSFYTLGEETREVSFGTTDKRLIDILDRVVQHEIDRSTETQGPKESADENPT